MSSQAALAACPDNQADANAACQAAWGVTAEAYASSGQWQCATVGDEIVNRGPLVCDPVVCTNENDVGVRYVKFFEVGVHPDTVASDAPLLASVYAAFTAFTQSPLICTGGCVHAGIPDPADPGGIFYKTDPLPGPQYELFRGYSFDRYATACTGDGDAGTLAQGSAGASELVQSGATPGTGGGTGATTINEAGTPTGVGALASAKQAQSMFDDMMVWLESADFVPTLPWSFTWDLPSGACVDPTITWLGQTASWGLCTHPATENFRLLWAWAFAMLAAFRVWSLAMQANS